MSAEMDTVTSREGTAGPGHDTRAWVSFGTVQADSPNQHSVSFADANGNVLPWPTIQVEMHPSGDVASCRVANTCAGEGEGEWYPFVAGDEVIVLIPQGDERAGCTIIGRLNQMKDIWPAMVAGQDSTTNTFGFKRMVAPYIMESAASLLFRNATTNSFISIDKTGNVTLSEGSDNGFIHVGTDFIGMQSGDNSTLVQIDPTNKQVLLQADTMQLILDALNTQLMTNGSLLISTSGMTSVPGHAVSAEQVIALMAGMIIAIGVLNPGPLIGAALAAGVTNIMNAAIAATITPATSPTQFQGALAAALAFPTDPSGSIAGFGRGGFRL